MATKIQLRRDTKLNWETTNPILSQGEPGLETNTAKIKHGDGIHPWNELPYMIEGDKTATTGSNTFVGNQTIDGVLNVNNIILNNSLYVIDNVNNAGLGNTATVTGYIDPLRDFRILSFVNGGPIVVGMTVQGAGVNSDVTITAIPGAGGSSIGTYKIDGQLTKVGTKYSPITFSVGYPTVGQSYITGSLVWDLNDNYWKGGISGSEIQLANVDYVNEELAIVTDLISSSYLTTLSFNAYTTSYSASQSTINNTQSSRLTTLEANTSSYSLTTNVNTLSSSFNSRIIAATNEQSLTHLVTTSSFNSFTSSYYIDSASAYTSRLNNVSSISALNTFTSSYTTTSASFNTRIIAATNEQFLGGFATTSSFNSFSASVHTEIANINVANASTGSTILGVTAKTGATGVVTHDCSNTSIFYHTSPTANFTANFTNLGLTSNKYRQIKIVILQGGTARVPNAVQIDGVGTTVSFKGNTGHNNLTDICTFDIINNNGIYIVLADIYGGY